ncbi:hypothetical protein Tco_1447612 [Tanacetum coccineum]
MFLEILLLTPPCDMGLLDYIRTADPFGMLQALESSKGGGAGALFDSKQHCFSYLLECNLLRHHQASCSGSVAGAEGFVSGTSLASLKLSLPERPPLHRGLLLRWTSPPMLPCRVPTFLLAKPPVNTAAGHWTSSRINPLSADLSATYKSAVSQKIHDITHLESQALHISSPALMILKLPRKPGTDFPLFLRER